MPHALRLFRDRGFAGAARLDGLDRDHRHRWAAPGRPFLALCPLPTTDAFPVPGRADAR